MDAVRLHAGTAASEAALILHAALVGARAPETSVQIQLGIGVTRVARILALSDLRRLQLLDCRRAAEDAMEVRLRTEWRHFLGSDEERARRTAERLLEVGTQLLDVDARRLIDDALRRFRESRDGGS